MGSDESTVDDDEVAVAAGPDLPLVHGDRYVIEDELSRGGLGRVMRGRDQHLERTVAIKQLLAHSARLEARFRREARITARLQHPGIVPIYEAGRLPSGESFYAMKLITGHPLRDELDRSSSLDDRLALIPKLIAVCDAVAYAHSEHVIHRDLKPANIMVGPFGEVLVVDWGLAKDLDASGDDDGAAVVVEAPEGLTAAGSVLGTPPYMAPEQARGDAVDERCDVYALGATIYHALAGRAPHDEGPGKTLDRVLAGPPVPLAERERGVPRELAAIVGKAMQRDVTARYRNAGELVDDLRRFQTGQLVGAHRYSLSQLVARWLRRYRRAVVLATVSLAVIAAIAVISVRRVIDERDAARAARVAAEGARKHAEQESYAKDVRTGELYLMQAEHWLDSDPTVAMAWLARHAAGVAPDAKRIRELAIDATSRGAARELVRDLVATVVTDDGTAVGIDRDHHVALHRPGSATRAISDALPGGSPVAASRDGKYVAWADHAIELYDVAAGTTRELAPVAKAPPTELAFARGVLAVGEASGEIRLVDVATRAVRTLAGHKAPIDGLVASRDGSLLASTAADHAVRMWTIASGQARELPAEAAVGRMTFSDDATRFAWSGPRLRPRWADVATGAIHELPAQPVVGATALAFSPDSKSLATGGEDSTPRIVDLEHGKVRSSLKGHTDWINGLAWSQDGRVLVSAQSHGGPIFVWDLASGGRTALLGHDVTLSALVIAADGTIVTADKSGQTRWWPMPVTHGHLLAPHTGDYPELLPLPDGTFVSARDDHTAVWSSFDREPHVLAQRPPQTRYSAPASADRVAWGDANGDIWIVTLATLAVQHLDHVPTRELAFAPDGKRLAIATNAGAVRVWTFGDKPEKRDFAGHEGEVAYVAFSPDGRLVSAGTDMTVRQWTDAGQGTVIAQPAGPIEAITFSPEGVLAVGRGAGLIELIDATGTRRTLTGHTAGITQLAWVSAGQLASAANDGTVRIWDTRTAQVSAVLPHRGHVQSLAVLPDGRLASGNAVEEEGDATIRIWDIASGLLVDEWHGHKRTIYAMAVSRDGKTLISSGTDYSLRTWPIPPATPVRGGDATWLRTLTSVDLGPGDIAVTPPTAR